MSDRAKLIREEIKALFPKTHLVDEGVTRGLLDEVDRRLGLLTIGMDQILAALNAIRLSRSTVDWPHVMRALDEVQQQADRQTKIAAMANAPKPDQAHMPTYASADEKWEAERLAEAERLERRAREKQAEAAPTGPTYREVHKYSGPIEHARLDPDTLPEFYRGRTASGRSYLSILGFVDRLLGERAQ